jgi:hypothetical protein
MYYIYLINNKKGVFKMRTNKEKSLENYKIAKKSYLEDMTRENWIKFCEAKKNLYVVRCKDIGAENTALL